MHKVLVSSAMLLFIIGCSDTQTQSKNLDGKKLLEQKCASCHNLDMPPKISNDELVPPMMAVAFHVHRLVNPSSGTQRIVEAKNFVIDYVTEPSLEKSFCDKESLKKYGLMPSQKANLSDDELRAVAEYMFRHYTQEKLTEIQKQKEIFDAYSDGKKVALKYKCLSCHRTDRKIVGPSFSDVALVYKNQKELVKENIKNGTKAKWKNSNGAIMPAFKQITDEELEFLANWIIEGTYN